MSDNVELHLNIIGNYLEHADLYRDRRLEGVKHLVWTTIAEIGQDQVSVGAREGLRDSRGPPCTCRGCKAL